MPIVVDCHSHHWRCGHAVGNMDDYIRAAYELGMTHFGVSDHGPAYWLPGDHAQPSVQMALSELPAYVREAHELKARFGNRLTVLVGVEADYIEGQEAALAELLAANRFDYVLGSVHYAFGRNIFNPNRWQEEEPDAVYREYYRLVIQAARSGLFDILSHLSAVEAFGPPVADALQAELYPEVADAVAESGCIVEVNTSGYRKMPHRDEPFPNRRLLAELIVRGVPLTFGSDCHAPEEVGFGRERVERLLAELGVGTGVQLHRVRRTPIPILVTEEP